jgi:hypothetical protein
LSLIICFMLLTAICLHIQNKITSHFSIKRRILLPTCFVRNYSHINTVHITLPRTSIFVIKRNVLINLTVMIWIKLTQSQEQVFYWLIFQPWREIFKPDSNSIFTRKDYCLLHSRCAWNKHAIPFCKLHLLTH